MTKKEVLALGKYPCEFLDNLVSHEPSIHVSSSTKLIWNCTIHGEYEQTISDHLRSMQCPKCSKAKAVLNRQKDRLSKSVYSDEFLRDIEESPDKDKIISGELKRNDKAIFVCRIHGNYSQRIAGHMSGKGCPMCRYNKSSDSISKTFRDKNPYSQSFIDDLEGSSDRENVMNGTLKSHDKAYFLCKLHGYYKQLIYDHLYGKGCPTCASNFSSKREESISNFLSSKGINFIRNDRNVLSESGGYELDLYLPDFKTAFEFNGYLFHCSGSKTKYGYGGKPKYYHRNKTNLCLSKGIKLYHIWEDCSDELCLSIIKAKLGLCNKVYARKCTLLELDKNEEERFFSVNHVDGYTRSIKSIALSFDNKIVSAISLRKNFSNEFEIARYSNSIGTEVVGGYSRLLKYIIIFLKEQGVSELISFCNRDLSPDKDNNFYANQGFHFIGEGSLIMKYYSLEPTIVLNKQYKAHSLISRFNLRKEVLIKELGDKYKEGMSEQECAELLNFRPVYNSGNFKYSLKL